MAKRIINFLPKITTEALKDCDNQGDSALYYIVKYDLLKDIADNITV